MIIHQQRLTDGEVRIETVRRRSRRALTAAVGAVLPVILTACAGGVGAQSEAEEGEGVSPRADFSEYERALADMEPTTLVYQPTAQSPNTRDAPGAIRFKENVEEASGGKITVELVYGQAIAPYDEVPDALADGRLDLAYALPVYDPSRFPVTNAFIAGSTLGGTSPRAEELAVNAALLDVAWNSSDLIDEFESQGLHPLTPINADASVIAMCTEPGVEAADWKGRQVRVGSPIHLDQMSAIGASPVSMEYTETYEALQRGVVDCNLSPALGALTVGMLELVPHYSYTVDASFSRSAGAVLAGQGYEKLPLAAKQLVFDQMVEEFDDRRQANLAGNLAAAEIASTEGGSFERMAPEVEAQLVKASESAVEEKIDSGAVPDDFDEQVRDALDKWRGIVDDMGLGDKGSFEDLAEWHDPDKVDMLPFAERVYDEVMVDHRPS